MRGLGWIAVLFGLAACSRPAPDTRGTDEHTIREMEAAWSKAAEAKDLEKFLAFYAEDAVYLPPNQPALNGWNNIGGSLLTVFKDPAFWLTFQTRHLEAARSGDVAFTYGVYSMTFTGAKGERVSDTGKYMTIWKKQFDGRWKAAFVMYNSDLTAPRPAGK